MKPIVVRSAIVAATGGLLFGFDTAVISGAEEQIQQVFALSDAKLGFTVTTALIGTILGALVAGRPADRYGRKKALYVIGVLFVLGALGSALAPNVEILMLFRFIGGIGVGGASVCAPIYTAEIAPAANRGRLVGWCNSTSCSASSSPMHPTPSSARRSPATMLGAGCSAS